MSTLDGIDTKYLLLEVADRTLDAAGREAKRQEVLALIKGNSKKKVQKKCDQLFDWVQNGGKLNTVIVRTIRVLMSDGYLTSGINGNLYQDLLREPYTAGTATSQASQMFSMLPMLKIALNDSKDRFVPNPDSMLLMKLNAGLGLTLGVSVC